MEYYTSLVEMLVWPRLEPNTLTTIFFYVILNMFNCVIYTFFLNLIIHMPKFKLFMNSIFTINEICLCSYVIGSTQKLNHTKNLY